ncbi:hypothetical protein JCM11251_003827 [Rhodosporidiobolus azoricus]
MGHGSNDKLYITHAEHSGALGQHSAGSIGAQKKNQVLSKLPFDCCALTLKPFDTPVATTNGTIYELMAIIPFLREHGTDPMTGEKLAAGDLIRLNFQKNNEGQYHDPITYKVFNDHTAIAAVRQTGNVYARESIDRLNIKPGNLNDLLTDEPFTKKDIITLNDPLNIQKRDLTKFDYVRRALKVDIESEGGLSGINVEAGGLGRIMKAIGATSAKKERKDGGEEDEEKKEKAVVKSKADPSSASTKQPTPNLVSSASSAPTPYNTATVSTNRAAASLTSTAAGPYTKMENALWDEEDLMYEQVRERGEKAYVRMRTSSGELNFELFADRAPRTCYNFLRLAAEGKYENIKFHRLIPGFMLQGGDPTGTGRGGESYWGKPFEDEYNVRNAYKHEQRGTLSMANSGPNTNGSQFFITFRDKCPHLDGKHTVFGRLVGGHTTLDKLERIPIDATDRPLKQCVLLDVEVFGDPFEEYKKRLEKRLERERDEREGAGEKARRMEERRNDRTTWFGTTLNKDDPASSTSTASLDSLLSGSAPSKASSSSASVGIGKYLSSAAPQPLAGAGTKRKAEAQARDSGLVKQLEEVGGAEARKKKRAGGGFGDFSGW